MYCTDFFICRAWNDTNKKPDSDLSELGLRLHLECEEFTSRGTLWIALKSWIMDFNKKCIVQKFWFWSETFFVRKINHIPIKKNIMAILMPQFCNSNERKHSPFIRLETWSKQYCSRLIRYPILYCWSHAGNRETRSRNSRPRSFNSCDAFSTFLYWFFSTSVWQHWK